MSTPILIFILILEYHLISLNPSFYSILFYYIIKKYIHRCIIYILVILHFIKSNIYPSILQILFSTIVIIITYPKLVFTHFRYIRFLNFFFAYIHKQVNRIKPYSKKLNKLYYLYDHSIKTLDTDLTTL